jgi:NAD(P) transhydrogenase subunit alpha
MLRIGVPRETAPDEKRVALVPETAGRLAKSGFEVVVESGAGVAASHTDADYQAAGATIAGDARALFATADVVLKVREPLPGPGGHEADLLREGSVLITLFNPARNADLIARLTARRITAFAMELMPRTTRAQKMDALSSMSTAAGYKAALLAATTLGRFFPLLMTAAGTIAPARVFVLGAGVAGLQAIATSRRLGAVVEAFDVRPAVREEVQSLGATFVHLELTDEKLVGEGGYAKALSADQEAKERDLIHQHVKGSDVVITTALVPGRKAPVLITEAMVRDMRPGSVIVDLAAETGGNCELTKAGEVTVAHGVTIHGPLNIAATLPVHASQMYSRNISALLLNLVKDGALNLDFEDDITRDTCVTHEGRVLKGTASPATSPPSPAAGGAPSPGRSPEAPAAGGEMTPDPVAKGAS